MLSWGNWKANAFWGGKMSEEQATEEGRLEFIKAKYFERELGVPELDGYTDVESPVDTCHEGPYPFEVTGVNDDEKEDVFKKFSTMAMDNPLRLMKKKVAARRVSVSSSESDGDITEVLKGVVRDYTATHARGTRPAERIAETQGSGGGKAKQGKDLIRF